MFDFFSNKLNPQHFYNKDIKYLFCLWRRDMNELQKLLKTISLQ